MGDNFYNLMDKVISVDFAGKVEFRHDWTVAPLGTSLQEEMVVSYQKLVEVFGKPNAKGDEYKIDAEWIVFTVSGVATIYNWKDGKNYLGAEEGLPVEDITDWHIGGHSDLVVHHIKRALGIEK